MLLFFTGAFLALLTLFVVWTFLVVSKILHDVTQITNAMKVFAVKLNKLEQIGIATMGAAENFTDALRESNGEMGPPMGMSRNDDVEFDDLRESFENGIKRLEDDSDEEEGENWKKKQ